MPMTGGKPNATLPEALRKMVPAAKAIICQAKGFIGTGFCEREGAPLGKAKVISAAGMSQVKAAGMNSLKNATKGNSAQKPKQLAIRKAIGGKLRLQSVKNSALFQHIHIGERHQQKQQQLRIAFDCGFGRVDNQVI